MKKTIQAEKSNEITISLSLFCNITVTFLKNTTQVAVFLLRQIWIINYYVKNPVKFSVMKTKKPFISREIVSFSMFCLEDNINTSVCFHYQDFLFKF